MKQTLRVLAILLLAFIIFILPDLYLASVYGGGVATLYFLGVIILLACLRPLARRIDKRDKS
ncbi:hypothetical protein [Deinococcus sp.]|uniref:hypothetical protein n=1 Tax=Deinococcus sp. TaxID=47478 RepID=UPI0025CD4E14|nr:hypothetical protein [Deinococcus sp.]